MKEGEELIKTTPEEAKMNYEKQIGPMPKNDPLTGKIKEIVDWLNENAHDPKSIEFGQWYEPYPIEDYWYCRLEFTAKNALGGVVKEDRIFKMRNGTVIEVVDK